MNSISIIYDKIRYEEKELYLKAQKRGLDVNIIDAKSLVLSTNRNTKDNNLKQIILQRCVSHFRGLYLTACLEFQGYITINSFNVGETCGNKLLTTLALSKNNIPTPDTHFSFSSDSALQYIHNSNLPIVLKPLIGSWGRGVFSIKDIDIANVIIEMREEDTSPFSRIYYLQEFIQRPPRDIRCIVVGEEIVAAIYRYSHQKEWRTNVAKGGRTEAAPITKELEDIVIKSSKAVGGGILGVDLMEDDKRGLLVHEINNTVEFRGASTVSNSDIANEIINYALKFQNNI